MGPGFGSSQGRLFAVFKGRGIQSFASRFIHHNQLFSAQGCGTEILSPAKLPSAGSGYRPAFQNRKGWGSLSYASANKLMVGQPPSLNATGLATENKVMARKRSLFHPRYTQRK